jgi:hypothetical protein
MTGHRIHFETEGFHMPTPFELVIFVDNTILHIMVPGRHRLTLSQSDRDKDHYIYSKPRFK